jgi:hypothetical protein
MRTYFTKRERDLNESMRKRQEVIDTVAKATDVASCKPLHKQIEHHTRVIEKAIKERGTGADLWQCSSCDEHFPVGYHVVAEIGCVIGNRGTYRPIIKDVDKSRPIPTLYLCYDCAIDLGVITQQELDRAIKEEAKEDKQREKNEANQTSHMIDEAAIDNAVRVEE